MSRPEQLNRYTDLAALLDILTHKRLVLLDPNFWDDKNDVHFMSTYKAKANINTLLALCFTSKYETYHHWSVFAQGNSGICIRFKRDKLIAHLQAVDGVRFSDVSYKEIRSLTESSFSISDIPFLKRYPYRDEKEFRVIYESNNNLTVKEVPFSLDAIDRIVLSPWLPEPLVKTVRSTINSIKDCADLKVYRTTLLSNDVWRKKVEQLV